MWNGKIGDNVKHLEKVLLITPWISLVFGCEKGMAFEEKKKY
jgi:hypothetical protein